MRGAKRRRIRRSNQPSQRKKPLRTVMKLRQKLLRLGQLRRALSSVKRRTRRRRKNINQLKQRWKRKRLKRRSSRLSGNI